MQTQRSTMQTLDRWNIRYRKYQHELAPMTQLFFIVTILCQMIYGTHALAQETHYVFNLAVTYDGQQFSVNFPMDRFVEFYRCLCQTATASCTAYVELHKVIYIKESHLDRHHAQLYTYYNRYVCQHVRYENAVVCSKLQQSQVNCSHTHSCLAYGVPNEAESTCSFGRPDLIWKQGQHMSGSYVYGMIVVKPCQPECAVVNMTTTARFDSVSSTSFSDLSTLLPFVDTVANVNTTFLVTPRSESHLYHFEDKKGIVVGVVVALVSLVFLAVIIGVFLWRRSKSSSLSKASKDISTTSHDTPTLIQLHHTDVLYANDDSFYAGIKTSNISHPTDVEVDSCWSARFSDCTEYEPDFSDFYNDSNISLEEYRTSAIPNQETQTQIYENYTTPTKVCLCSSNARFSGLPRDRFDSQDVCAVTDELIYEDFDRSAFDQIVEENSGSEDSAYSNLSTQREFTSDNVNEVKDSSFRNTTLSVKKSDLDSCLRQNHNDESDSKNGYSKLNEDLSIIKESYNNLSGAGSLEGNHGNQQAPGVNSVEGSCRSAEQPVRYSLTYDQVEVIAVSPRLQAKNVPGGNPGNNDQIITTKNKLTGKKSSADAATTQRQESNHFKKARAYFELESNFQSKRQDKGMPITRKT